MKKYLVVCFIETAPETFFALHWPLHLTIVRPFLSESSVHTLSNVIAAIASKYDSIETVGIKDELFGPANDVLVTEFDCPRELQILHNELNVEIQQYGTLLGAPFDQYRPHITYQNGKRIEVGEKVMLRSVSLILMGEYIRTVLKTISLRE